MGNIELRKEYLPTTVEELNTFILIGKQRLVAQKAKIRAIEQTRMAIAAQEAALADTQDMAEILIDAEVRMGEILEGIPAAGNTLSSTGGRKATIPPDITHKQSHQAQTLSKNREIVEQAKAEARENGEIVTASKVYQIIKDKPKLSDQPIIKRELVSDEFQAAFDQMVIELKNARALKWKTTSHKGAVELMQTLLNIAEQ